MSWDSYITNMSASGLQVSGIYGTEGGCWAESPDIKASQAEVANIVNGIKAQNFPNGITVGGVKFTMIGLTPDSVTAKGKNETDPTKNYLMHCALGKQCVVIGGSCGAGERGSTACVERIRDYLKQSGY